MKQLENNYMYLFDDTNIFSTEGIYSELHNSEYSIPHFHTYYEIVIMLRGEIEHLFMFPDVNVPSQKSQKDNLSSGRFPIAGTAFCTEKLEQGDVQIIPPHLCHFYKFINPNSEYINITISRANFVALTKFLNYPLFATKNLPAKTTVLQKKLSEIKEEFVRLMQASNITEHEQSLLNKFFAIDSLKNFVNVTEQKHDLPIWLQDLVALLHNPNYYALSISELITKTPYCHSYICREFKKAFGISLKSYFTGLKMKHAAYLLENTDYKIITIANMLGYGNPSFFAQIFSKYNNSYPFDYRKTSVSSPATNPDA